MIGLDGMGDFREQAGQKPAVVEVVVPLELGKDGDF